MIQSVSTAEYKTEYLRRLSGKPYFEAVLGTHLRLFGQHPASGWAFYLLPGTAVLELRGGSAVVCGALPGGSAGEDAREELAGFLRFLCSFLSGVLVWGNLSDGLSAWTYSLGYNASYMLPETLLTVVGAVLLIRVAPQIFDRQHAKA